MKHIHRPPPVRSKLAADRKRHTKALYTAAQRATNGASQDARTALQAKITGVGLGRLAGAVGQTSSQRKGQKPRTPYGATFVKGGDESRAGQALQSYTRGATIRARRRNWLAFPTNAVPRTINRRKITPDLYKKSGLVTRIGQLHFVQVKPNLAFLMIRKVTLHPRTHRAKRAGPGRVRTRVPAKEVVAFVLIKVTRRAMRFNKDRVVHKVARTMPDRLAHEMKELLPS